jgi:hypothetical protein
MSFAYDGAGREVGKTVAAAAWVTQVFDPAGQLLGVVPRVASGVLRRG